MAKEGKHILLIEDEPGLVITLTDRLKSEGYAGVHAGDGLKGEQMARERTPDLIILDLMLPKKGGLDVCRDLRNEGVTTPILMLTARGQTNEKVVGLKLGADDYLTKPYDMLELLARIESLLRRPAAFTGSFSAMPRYSFGTITVDFRSMEVFRKGKIINISQREFQLLKHFIEHRNTPLCRETIPCPPRAPSTRTSHGVARNSRTTRIIRVFSSRCTVSGTNLLADVHFSQC